MSPRRLGGSDIAKLLGVSRYGNAADVFLRSVEGVDDLWKPVMVRGKKEEPRLRLIASEKMALEIEDRSWNTYRPEPDYTENDYHAHPDFEFAHAQIDDLATWRGLSVTVDYKTQNLFARKRWGKDGSGDIPESQRPQAAWGMSCTDRELAIWVVGFGLDNKETGAFDLDHVSIFQIERDLTFESRCIETADIFWVEHVKPRVRPAMRPLGKKERKAS